jgi:hypothetical protein
MGSTIARLETAQDRQRTAMKTPDLRAQLLHVAELEGEQLAERLVNLINEGNCGEEQRLLNRGASAFEAFLNKLAWGMAQMGASATDIASFSRTFRAAFNGRLADTLLTEHNRKGSPKEWANIRRH